MISNSTIVWAVILFILIILTIFTSTIESNNRYWGFLSLVLGFLSLIPLSESYSLDEYRSETNFVNKKN